MTKKAWKKHLGSDADAHKRMGTTNHCLLEIHVDPTYPLRILKEVVVHEVLHALLYDFGVKPSLLITENEHEAEENLVSAISPRLNSVIQDNPDLLAWLMHDPLAPPSQAEPL